MGIATRKATLSTTRSRLIKPSLYRRSLTILNEDTGINVLIAPNNTDSGFVLLPQTSITLDRQGGNDPTLPLQLYAASGTPEIRILEDYAKGAV